MMVMPRTVLTISLVALSVSARAEPPPPSPPDVLGFHFTLAPRLEQFYREQFAQVSKQGYNTLFLMLSGGRGLCYRSAIASSADVKGAYTREQVAGLIAYARSLGLTVVPEVKIWGKQQKTLGRAYIRAHPDMFVGPESGKGALYDPGYRFPDGRTVHQAVVFPLIDEVIALFGETPPRYFNVGFDEYVTDYIGQLAERNETTAGALLAQELNRLTDYILSRGITPVMYQDLLLGSALAEKGHGVDGMDADPRFRNYTIMHAQHPPGSTTSVLTAMNHIRNRDRIIVVDWHYRGGTPEDEYPSVDYLLRMGFKAVWGQTWSSEHGIRTFARYMRDHNGAGMIASTYHTPRHPDVLHLYPRILHNSILYFRNPDYVAPPAPTLRVPSDGPPAPTSFLKPGNSLTVEVALPATVMATGDSALLVRGARAQGASIWRPIGGKGALDRHRRTISFRVGAAAALAAVGGTAKAADGMSFFDCRADVFDQSGYLLQTTEECLFAVTREIPDVSWSSRDDPALLCDLTFETPEFLDRKQTIMAIPGAQPLIGFLHKAEIVRAGGTRVLQCNEKGGLIVMPSKPFLRGFAEAGISFEAEFMVTQRPSSAVHMLFSYGRYQSGMRLFVSKDLTIEGQVAQRVGGRVILNASTKVRVGAWHSLQFTLAPGRNRATITLDGKRVADAAVPNLVPSPSDILLSVGLEHKPSVLRNVTAHWEFPGFIRSFRVLAIPRAGR